jgi:hypothetical protein
MMRAVRVGDLPTGGRPVPLRCGHCGTTVWVTRHTYDGLAPATVVRCAADARRLYVVIPHTGDTAEDR